MTLDFETVHAFSRGAGLVYFAALFVAVIAWALWPRNQSRFDAAARIPLHDDE